MGHTAQREEPGGFYLRYGFSRTGQVFGGEDVLELRLGA
jgi:hypothetical protein